MSPRTLLSAGLALCGLGLPFFLLSRPAVQRAVWLSPPLRPVLMQGLGNATDSDEHAKYFLLLVRGHQYAEARSLLTLDAQKSLPVSRLQAEWLTFEKAHGRITQWTLTGEKSNLLPAYVDKIYSVSGSRGSAGSATLHMTQMKGSWQIARLTVAK